MIDIQWRIKRLNDFMIVVFETHKISKKNPQQYVATKREQENP